jgi:uncharacterized BrkB/YihY/UPF0761 family membrane protein
MVVGLKLLITLVCTIKMPCSRASSRIHLGFTLPVTTVLPVIVLLALMLALVYNVLPSAHDDWRDLLVGSLVAAAPLALGGYVMGLYLGAGKFSPALNAAGASRCF